jgi:two-component system, cell cycle sensor histidine kinase and response regulator CckA
VDITQRKRDKREHRERELRMHAQFAELEQLYRYAPVGLCVLDRDLRYVRINDRLEEINGISAEAHLGRTVHAVVPTLANTVEDVTARILVTGLPLLNDEFCGETAAFPGVIHYWNES